MKPFSILLTVFVFMSINAVAQTEQLSLPDQAQLEKMIARFAPTPLKVDTSKLSKGDRAALAKMIQAARLLNDVFLKQLWSGNTALYAELQKDTTPLGKARLHYFWMNKGPCIQGAPHDQADLDIGPDSPEPAVTGVVS